MCHDLLWLVGLGDCLGDVVVIDIVVDLARNIQVFADVRLEVAPLYR